MSRTVAVMGAPMIAPRRIVTIVPNVGLEPGIVSPTVVALMVLMALATTMMTAPAVRWWIGPSRA